MRLPRAALPPALLLVASLAVAAAHAGPPSPVGAPASAQSASSDPAAAEVFKQALQRYQAKDFASALPMFRQVLEQSGSPNARLYVARCLKEMGQLAQAYEEMARTARDANELAAGDAKYAATRDAAAAALAIMDKLVAKVFIRLESPPAGTTVTLGGRSIGLERLGKPIAVETGAVSLRVTAPGKAPVEQSAELEAGGQHVFTVLLRDVEPSEPGPAPPPETSGGEVRLAGWVLLGVGAASLIAFGVTGGLALDDFSTLEEECGGVRCTDPSYADLVDRGTTLRTTANVTLAVGATLAAAGIAMAIFGGPTEQEAAPTVAIALGPSGGAIGLAGAF